MTAKARLRDTLRAEIDRIPIVDNHEHLLAGEFPGSERMHLIRFLSYCCVRHDLRSAGLRAGFWERFWVGNADTSLEDPAKDWQELSPHLSAVRCTAYHRYLLAAWRDLFGFDVRDLDDHNWQDLSAQIERAYRDPKWFGYVLGDRSSIRVAFNDLTQGGVNTWTDSPLLRPVFHLDHFLVGDPKLKNVWGVSANALAQQWGRQITDLDSLLAVVDEGFRRYRAARAPGVKVNAAYWRALDFQPTCRLEAERSFRLIVRGQPGGDARLVGDYVLSYCIERSTELGWPIQVHTGMQTGSGNWLEYGKPTHLNGLFLRYPEARFEILHAGFPYTDEAAVLAKLFPNVYLDFCWVPLISPQAAAEGLSKWIELIPNHKLLWGGDSRLVEQTYASVLALKDVLAGVLADKIERGYFDWDLALQVAEGLMWRNAADLFGLAKA